MENWGVQGVEYIWFKSTADGLNASTIYKLITGEEPDTYQTTKTPTALSPYLSLASGTIREIVHQVGLQPGRVDYTVSCPDRSNGPWAWRLQEGLKTAHATLEPANRFTAQLGRPTRLAFHLNLLRNVASALEVREFLLPKMGLKTTGEVTDLSFQINRKMRSKVADVEINRLVRFNTASLQQVMISPSNPNAVISSANMERHLATLNLDINTLPVPRGIDTAEAVLIFGELLAEGVAIAELGTLEGFLDR